MNHHNMRKHSFLAGAAMILTAVLIGAGCSPAFTPTPTPSATAPTTPPTTAPTAATKTVSIAQMAFLPASISVSAGTTVTWTNNDSRAHTVTADDGSFDSGNLAPGASFSHAFKAGETVAYHCTYHSGMHGAVTVQ